MRRESPGVTDARRELVKLNNQSTKGASWNENPTFTGSGVLEQDPAIACNSLDHTRLIAFEYSGTGNGDIYGQRVSAGGSNISREGTRSTIGGYSAAESNPAVAWGGCDDDYLVVWQYLHDTPSNHDRILAGYVWDTNQADSQIEAAGTYLIPVLGHLPPRRWQCRRHLRPGGQGNPRNQRQSTRGRSCTYSHHPAVVAPTA